MVEHHRTRGDEIADGQGTTRGIALPTELLPHLMEQIGFEPMTDNPMSSAHQNERAGKERKWIFPTCCHCTIAASGETDLNRYFQGIDNPLSTARQK